MILADEKGTALEGNQLMVGAEFCSVVNAMRKYYGDHMMKFMFDLGMKDDEDVKKPVGELKSELANMEMDGMHGDPKGEPGERFRITGVAAGLACIVNTLKKHGYYEWMLWIDFKKGLMGEDECNYLEGLKELEKFMKETLEK